MQNIFANFAVKLKVQWITLRFVTFNDSIPLLGLMSRDESCDDTRYDLENDINEHNSKFSFKQRKKS